MSTGRTPEHAVSTSVARRAGLAADTRGLSTVEYVIILCLIAVSGYALWKQLGQTIEYKARGAQTQVGTLPAETSPGD